MATHLLSGNDESVLRSAVHELVDELVGDGDRAMMVDEFDDDEYELRLVVDAAQTPSFLTDKRVVVARGVDRFNADELAPLLAYLANPLDSSDLVLVDQQRERAEEARRRSQGGRHGHQHLAAVAGQGPPGVDRRSHRRGRVCGSSRTQQPSSAPGWARTPGASTASSPP